MPEQSVFSKHQAWGTAARRGRGRERAAGWSRTCVTNFFVTCHEFFRDMCHSREKILVPRAGAWRKRHAPARGLSPDTMSKEGRSPCAPRGGGAQAPRRRAGPCSLAADNTWDHNPCLRAQASEGPRRKLKVCVYVCACVCVCVCVHAKSRSAAAAGPPRPPLRGPKR